MSPPAGGLDRRRWTILALLMLISAAHQVHRVGISDVGDQVMRDLKISPDKMGDLYSAFLITYTLFMTPGGWLADKKGAWFTLLLVIGGSSLFGGIPGLAGWFFFSSVGAAWWIAASRWSMGILSAPLYPSTSQTVSRWFGPNQQTWANGLVIAAAPLGMAFGSQGMSILSQHYGWEAACLIAGIATSVVFGLWAYLGRAQPLPMQTIEPLRKREPIEWKKLLTHRGILALTLSYAAVGYFEYVFFYWIKYYFKEILNLEERTSANYTTATRITMAAGTLVGGWICSRLARLWGLSFSLRLVTMVSMGMAALLLTLGTLSKDHILFSVVALSLALGCIGASEGPFWTAAVLLGGKRFGATSAGIINTGGNLGGIFGPKATPRIAMFCDWILFGDAYKQSQIGWTVSLIAGSIVCLAGVLFWLWVDVEKPVDFEEVPASGQTNEDGASSTLAADSPGRPSPSGEGR